MQREDVDQVTEIDHQAFPTQWPPPNYQHELRNRLAHYIVAYDKEKSADKPGVKAPPEKRQTGLIPGLRRLFSHRSPGNELLTPSGQYIVGFVGLWIMADEAHIINIAVREEYRQQGIGELLLISAIGLATELKARIATREVRVSNTAAQSLYTKYGFTQVGVRRGYYLDRGYQVANREDAILMSTQDINSAEFQAHLQQLIKAHSQNRGLSPLTASSKYPAQQDNQ